MVGPSGLAKLKTYIQIVAPVVFKAVYAKAIVEQPKGGEESRVQTILGTRERYQQFGCENPEQVDVLAEAVSFSLLLFYSSQILQYLCKTSSINWRISGRG